MESSGTCQMARYPEHWTRKLNKWLTELLTFTLLTKPLFTNVMIVEMAPMEEDSTKIIT
jgi:hypothetical protein